MLVRQFSDVVGCVMEAAMNAEIRVAAVGALGSSSLGTIVAMRVAV